MKENGCVVNVLFVVVCMVVLGSGYYLVVKCVVNLFIEFFVYELGFCVCVNCVMFGFVLMEIVMKVL